MLAPSLETAAGERKSKRCEVADIFRAYGAHYRSAPPRSPTQDKALRDIELCRTAALGGHLEQCPACAAPRPVYNSCRNRHCPKCQALAQAQWREAQHAFLLPIPYCHLVFTLPPALNDLLRGNPRLLYTFLFQAAADTLKEFAHDPPHLGAALGLTAVLHTWGQTLSYHVHLHRLVTGGGLSLDGTHWVAGTKRGFLFPVRALAKMCCGKFRARLAAAYRKGAVVLQGPGAFALPAVFV